MRRTRHAEAAGPPDRSPGRCGPRRPGARAAVAVLAAALAAALLQACMHPTLGRPAFVGASATAGVGASTDGGQDGPLAVDLAVAFDSTVTAPHQPPARHADALVYQRPQDALREQAAAARADGCTVLFALDWLFWPAYGGVKGDAPAQAADPESVRVARVDAALAELASFDPDRTVIVLGDLPCFQDGCQPTARPVEALPAATVEALNRRIRGWVEAHPNAVLVPISRLAAPDRCGPDGAPLLQPDGLHPTAQGLLLLVNACMEALQARGLVKPGDWNPDAASAATGLPSAARRAMETPSAGWLDRAGMILAYRSLEEQLDPERREPPDCGNVTRTLESLLRPAPGLEADPVNGWGILAATMMTHRAIAACPEAAGPVKRCLARMDMDVRRPQPNPFRLELWCELSLLLGRHQAVEERLEALALSAEPAGDAYLGAFTSVRSRFRDSPPPGEDPAAFRAASVRIAGGPQRLLAAELTRMKRARERAAAKPDADMAGDDAVTVENLLDLRAAAITGMPGAAEAAAALRAALGESGEASIQRALALAPESGDSPFQPNGSVQLRGCADCAALLAEGVPAGGYSIAFRMVAGACRADEGPAPPPGAERVAFGLLGPFGAPAGAWARVDGRSVMTRTAAAPAGGAAWASEAPSAGDVACAAVIARGAWGAEQALPPAEGADAIERALWDAAIADGRDPAFPFVVRAEAQVEDLEVLLPAGAEPGPAPLNVSEMILGSRRTAEQAPAPLRPPLVVPVEAPRVTLLAVGAPAAVGSVVAPGRRMRIHVVWTDAAGSTHTAVLHRAGAVKAGSVRVLGPEPGMRIPGESARGAPAHPADGGTAPAPSPAGAVSAG